jgi:hypothetical protein
MSEARQSERMTQLDLFRAPPPIPDWDQLPPDVRHKTVTLLARMVRPHRRTSVCWWTWTRSVHHVIATIVYCFA